MAISVTFYNILFFHFFCFLLPHHKGTGILSLVLPKTQSFGLHIYTSFSKSYPKKGHSLQYSKPSILGFTDICFLFLIGCAIINKTIHLFYVSPQVHQVPNHKSLGQTYLLVRACLSKRNFDYKIYQPTVYEVHRLFLFPT